MIASESTVLSGLFIVACWAMLPVAVAALIGVLLFGAIGRRRAWPAVVPLTIAGLASVRFAVSVAVPHIPFWA